MKTRARIAAASLAVATVLTGVGYGASYAAPRAAVTCEVTNTSTVMRGSVGSTVRSLQCMLNHNGNKLAVDGIFGSQTEAAVRAYQGSHGLQVDGIVGPRTWYALLDGGDGDVSTSGITVSTTAAPVPTSRPSAQASSRPSSTPSASTGTTTTGSSSTGSSSTSTSSRPTTTPSASTGSSSTSSDARTKAVEYAKAQLGKPYVYGATGPDSFDCSGLTMSAMKAAGKTVPRTAAQQLGAGTKISASELQPGDLVVYYGGGHVGIYVGDGKVIHAPTTGRNVEYRGGGISGGTPVRFL